MTTAQKKSALAALAAFVIPLLTAIASIGAARRELDGKEDTSAHVLDVRSLEARMDLQRLRDSAQMAIMLSRITDVACEQRPARRYCR